jgi:catechol 2,3-dioxygenase-like lactoylglutathione lyase family enzyme
MRIGLTVVYVDDQAQAEWFYTDVLGMTIKTNAPYGHERWLTVVSPEDPDGVELVLYPAAETAREFQQASRELGRPAFALRSNDCLRDTEQLKAKGVVFLTEPDRQGYGGMDAVFDDTCGNLIDLHQD